VRILVTGAAGFIGSHLVRHLQSRHEVVGIDDLTTGSLENLRGTDCRLVEGSILDDRALADAVSGCDAVVHLAARPSVPRSIADPLASNDSNVTGTLRVLQASRELDDPLVIVASSSSVYGANKAIPKSETDLTMPMSPYAVSKLATEQYAIAWQHSYGMRTLAFRFFNVYGPRQAPSHAYAAVIPAFLWSALRNEPLRVHGDGLQSRDFTYVTTVCDVITDALERRVTHDWPVNLAFGTRVNLLEVIEELERVLGRKLRSTHEDPRPGDVRHSQADNSLLRSLFPDVSPAPLRDGLTATAEWMRTII
jgi:UDP-glucose 4-epimerase